MSEPLAITGFETFDIRFPTARDHDGSDAMNPDPDYSAAYVILHTSDPTLEGHGFAFTIGEGTEICVTAIRTLAAHVLGSVLEDTFADMGAFSRRLIGISHLRWIGPEKGVIHLAAAAILNAAWDLMAKTRGMPVWRLVADMTPEQLVALVDFRYLTDALTPDQALAILGAAEPGKAERIAQLEATGYPAYTTSAGWLGYDDDKVRRLCQEALADGFDHLKLKVGRSLQDDLRRTRIAREVIGPGRQLMVDANQVWSVPEAIDWVRALAEVRPMWIEEPTSPDDILGHAAIARAVAPIKVATGEHVHNRVMWKQLFQANAVSYAQVDACRLASVNEVLAVLLLATRFGVPVCPHAGGVGLCELVVHLAAIDFVCVSGTMDGRVVEWVDHLHEHFREPARVSRARYQMPRLPGYAQLLPESMDRYRYPDGTFWIEDATHRVPHTTRRETRVSAGERFLVTGAMGCIGAWTVHELVRSGTPVVAFDRSGDPRRLRMLLTDEELARVVFVTGDITDGAAFGSALDAHRITNVIHLAALQVPFCRADPVLGAQVNVVGTVVVFEQVRQRRERMAPVVYAGSIGMFDAADADDVSHRLLADATAHPANLYGVYKLANEGAARVYWQEHDVASFGIRPLTVYGPGRDQGLTSGPTRAMVAAALGRGYHIPYGGSTLYQFAPDVARTFLRASTAGLQGALTANLGGTQAHMREVVSLIEHEVPSAAGTITFEAQPLPFPDDIDSSGLAPLGEVPVTPLADGVAQTIGRFRALAADGRLHATEQGLEPA